MRNLFLGSSGFIGQARKLACLVHGDEVLDLSHTTGAKNHPDCQIIIGDREDVTGVLGIVKQSKIDCVIDFRAMSLETTAPLVAALAAQSVRYVLISSCDVYRHFVMRDHPKWTILRLPMVFGLGDTRGRFDWALHHFEISSLVMAGGR